MVEYFDIGYISNTHALKGEVKVRPYTDDSKRFGKLKKVLVDFNGNLVSYDIEQVRYQQDMVLLKLKTIDSIEQAEKLKNHYIKIPRSEAKSLEDGEYFIADLIGCEVYENELIGVLDDPLKEPVMIKLDTEKYEAWVKNGARPTDKVRALFNKVSK